MKDKYDVIIIGAGIGGLFCGCYLAKEGLKVLIVEKNNKAGGCATSMRLNNFNFDMGAHLIGGCDRDGLLTHYLKKMQLNIEFIKLNPFDRFIFNMKAITEISGSLDLYIENLQCQFSREKKNIELFFDEMINIYRASLVGINNIGKYSGLTYQDLLNTYIKSKKLQGILSAQCIYVGLPPQKASLVAVSFMMISYLRYGMYYTKGGTQNLADKLVSKLREYSGDILYNTEATKIIVKKNRAEGILTNNDNLLKGKTIISNCDAAKTYLNMIGRDKLRKPFIKELSSMKKGISFYQLHLGVDIDSKYLKKTSGWYYEDYNIRSCFKNAFYIFVPSLFDKTLAPQNRHIIHSLMVSPHDSKKIMNPNMLKRRVEAFFLKNLQMILKTDIKKRIVTKIVSTPRDIEEFTGNSCGSAYGWEMSPQNILEHRLGNISTVNNLYLAGHWTNPGCGVLGVATSGIITGRKVMRAFA